MEIKKCPRWENYGMGEDGRFYSYRKRDIADKRKAIEKAMRNSNGHL